MINSLYLICFNHSFRTEHRLDEDEQWMEKEELPLETRCKMAGMKMMARWLLGLKVHVTENGLQSGNLTKAHY